MSRNLEPHGVERELPVHHSSGCDKLVAIVDQLQDQLKAMEVVTSQLVERANCMKIRLTSVSRIPCSPLPVIPTQSPSQGFEYVNDCDVGRERFMDEEESEDFSHLIRNPMGSAIVQKPEPTVQTMGANQPSVASRIVDRPRFVYESDVFFAPDAPRTERLLTTDVVVDFSKSGNPRVRSPCCQGEINDLSSNLEDLRLNMSPNLGPRKRKSLSTTNTSHIQIGARASIRMAAKRSATDA